MTPTYCQNPACDPPRETKEGRRYCERCWKRAQRAKRGGIPLSAPPVERLPPMERALEAVHRLSETPAEDDEAYEANRRALMGVLKEMRPEAIRTAIREGLARARAKGVRLGRPPKLSQQSRDLARALVPEVGLMAAARVLRVDRRTLRRALGQQSEIVVGATEGLDRPQSKIQVSPARRGDRC